MNCVKIVFLLSLCILFSTELYACIGCGYRNLYFSEPYLYWWNIIAVIWFPVYWFFIALLTPPEEYTSFTYFKRMLFGLLACQLLAFLLFPGLLLYLIVPLLPVVLIYHLIVSQKRDSGFIKTRLFFLQLSTLILLLGSAVVTLIPERPPTSNPKVLGIICADNLKEIGRALLLYADSNDGFFPDRSSVAGLNMLLREGKLADGRIFRCPAEYGKRQKPAADAAPLTEETCSYEYRGGFSIKNKEHIPILTEKAGNHKRCRNVLYLDGSIEEVADK